MKKNTLTLIALGIGAYFLLKPKSAAAIGGDDGDKQTMAQEAPSYTVSGTTNQGVTVSKVISSVQQGVDFMNDKNVTLDRTSTTLATGVNVGDMTGNIAKLGTGATVFISAKEASKNSAGQTALDVQIAKNYAASGAENKSFKSFW